MNIMEELVMRKFTDHVSLSQLLIDTHPHELIEGNTWGDKYWGVCKGPGMNNLGKILMRTRDTLR